MESWIYRELKEQDGRFDGKLTKLQEALEEKIEEEVGNLAAMTERRSQEILKQLDVKERVKNLEQDMQKIKTALHIL